MNLRNAAGGLSSRFAHLAGIALPKAKAEGDAPEEDDKKEREPEAEEKDEDERKDDGRAEEGEDEEKDAEGDDKEPEDEEPKDKDGKKAFAAGRQAERARCAAIFASPEAGLNPAMAAELAFNTSLSAKQAVGVLKAGAVAPARTGLGARMASTPAIKIGADQASDPPASKATEASQQASRILAAARAAGGKF